MIYTKLSDEPITLVPMCYLQREKHQMKPNGLWFEVDGDWRRWCEDNSFRLDTMAVTHLIEFDPKRVLFLTTAEELDGFTSIYAVDTGDYTFDVYRINWAMVAERFAGIVIAPYCWERRLDLMWYYGWDCASGCIWDLSIITRFEVTPTPVKTPEEQEIKS